MNCIEMLELNSDGSIKYQDILPPPLPPGTPKPTPKPLLTLQPMRKAPPVKRPVGRPRKRPIMETTSDEQVPAIPSQEDCVSSPSLVEQSVAKKKSEPATP